MTVGLDLVQVALQKWELPAPLHPPVRQLLQREKFLPHL